MKRKLFSLNIVLVLAMFVFGVVGISSISSRSVSAASSVLSGKKLLVDGDSIAYGKTRQDKRYSYGDFLKENHGMTVKNVAISGSRFYRKDGGSKKIANHLTKVKNTKYDYILLEGGTNDIHYYYKTNMSNTFKELKAYLTTVTNNEKWENAKIGFVIVPHPNYSKWTYSKNRSE